MRKLLVISLFLAASLTFYGQRLPGVVSASGQVTAGKTFSQVINDGNTLGYYIATTGYLTKDATDSVRVWVDSLGVNNLTATDNTKKQPIWITPDYIDFNGTTNTMTTGLLGVQSQPITVYMVVNQDSWTEYEYLVDDANNNRCYIQQRNATPGIVIYAGSFVGTSNNLALDTWGVVIAVFNGASSALYVDDHAAITGDVGAGTQNGLNVGSDYTGSNNADAKYKIVIRRKGADSAGDIAIIYNYLKSKL
jgi:hypothetical protein